MNEENEKEIYPPPTKDELTFIKQRLQKKLNKVNQELLEVAFQTILNLKDQICIFNHKYQTIDQIDSICINGNQIQLNVDVQI